MEIDLIGISPNFTKIRKLINQVTDTDLNIVVFGETGVGKEVVARSLYEKSKLCGKLFVKVNCAVLPDTLFESEMFGYERGAFTGAQKKMTGKFEQADSGVLFLDEIGDMPLALQLNFFHALQEGDFTPLGSEKLVNYHWAGNVRELQNVLKRTFKSGDGDGSIDEMFMERGNKTPNIPVETLTNRISIPTHSNYE